MIDSNLIYWPSQLPAPLIKREMPVNPRSQAVLMESGRARARRIHLGPLRTMQVTWCFIEDKYETFLDFFTTTIEQGSLAFGLVTIEQDPNPALARAVTREVSFLDGRYKFSGSDNLVVVETTLQIHDSETLIIDNPYPRCNCHCESGESGDTDTNSDSFVCGALTTTIENLMNAVAERILATQHAVIGGINPTLSAYAGMSWPLNEGFDSLTDGGIYNGLQFNIVPDGYYSTLEKKVEALQNVINLLTLSDPYLGSDRSFLQYYLEPPAAGDGITGEISLKRLWDLGATEPYYGWLANITLIEDQGVFDDCLQATQEIICFLTRLLVLPEADLESEIKVANGEVLPQEAAEEAAISAWNDVGNNYGSGAQQDWGASITNAFRSNFPESGGSMGILAERTHSLFDFSHLNAVESSPVIYWKVVLLDYTPKETSGLWYFPALLTYAPHQNSSAILNKQFYPATAQPTTLDLGTVYQTPTYGNIENILTGDIFSEVNPADPDYYKIGGWEITRQDYWVAEAATWGPDPHYFAVVYRSPNPAIAAWNFYP